VIASRPGRAPSPKGQVMEFMLFAALILFIAWLATRARSPRVLVDDTTPLDHLAGRPSPRLDDPPAVDPPPPPEARATRSWG
jgi:hypothetical protein